MKVNIFLVMMMVVLTAVTAFMFFNVKSDEHENTANIENQKNTDISENASLLRIEPKSDNQTATKQNKTTKTTVTPNVTSGVAPDSDLNTLQNEPAPTNDFTTNKSVDGVIKIIYSNSGFNPSVAELNVGDTVRFVNESSQGMWVRTYSHPTTSPSLEPVQNIDQGKTAFSGTTYSVTIPVKGIWAYKNINNQKHVGTFIVN